MANYKNTTNKTQDLKNAGEASNLFPRPAKGDSADKERKRLRDWLKKRESFVPKFHYGSLKKKDQ